MMKLLAMGNILMGDDGIALHLAGLLEERLNSLGIELIYGETDIGYCITRITEEDYIILLDAAEFGREPGEISLQPFREMPAYRREFTSHCISFLDLIHLYYPAIDGIVIKIQIAYLGFCYGPSDQLKNRSENMIKQLLGVLLKIKCGRN